MSGDTFSWYSIVPTLVGAGASIATTAVMFSINRSIDQKQKEKSRQLQDNAKAFSCAVKLMQIRAWHRVIKRAVDECFDETEVGAAADMDPGLKVVPLVGPTHLIEAFTSEELAIVLQSSGQTLVLELLNMRSNYEVAFEVVKEFNKIRSDFSSYASAQARSGSFLDGQHQQLDFDPKEQHKLEARIGLLNQILSEIISSGETDIPRVDGIILKFELAMRKKGMLLPDISSELGIQP